MSTAHPSERERIIALPLEGNSRIVVLDRTNANAWMQGDSQPLPDYPDDE